jgi:3-oxoacyl-[acyl-carrier-protein] synthase III
MNSRIRSIEYYLPEAILSNAALSAEFPEWSIEKIQQKTGIHERHIAAPQECASDLAFQAARKLFDNEVCRPADIDYILLCTQSPDYFLPTTACILQDRLGIPTASGALDFNLGCSGFIYGLGLAQGLIQTGQAGNVLLLTAETYSKFIHPQDKSVRTLFGDAAAATLICADSGDLPARAAKYIFGTDGKGAPNLIVPAGGMRQPASAATAEVTDDGSGNRRSLENLYMSGGEIFNFTLQVVPDCVGKLLAQTGKTSDEIDLFVFHQANQFMLDHLRRKLRVPTERFYVSLASCGNTVSSTIPIALKRASEDGTLKDGALVMLVGFGVGYSWGATLVQWPYLGYGAAE